MASLNSNGFAVAAQHAGRCTALGHDALALSGAADGSTRLGVLAPLPDRVKARGGRSGASGRGVGGVAPDVSGAQRNEAGGGGSGTASNRVALTWIDHGTLSRPDEQAGGSASPGLVKARGGRSGASGRASRPEPVNAGTSPQAAGGFCVQPVTGYHLAPDGKSFSKYPGGVKYTSYQTEHAPMLTATQP